MNYQVNNMAPQLADRHHCTGCMACGDACTRSAISTIKDEDGHYTYSVDESKCVLCHNCEKVCPNVSKFNYGDNDLLKSRPYAVWCTLPEIRERSTSGGVYAALAKTILEDNGIVIGAHQEQFYVKHILINSVDEIQKIQGSKYTQSDTTSIFKQVKDNLNSGKKVLFSGVGCQVAALLSFLRYNKHLDNLITVDLICGGAPSSLLIDRFVKEYEGKVQSIKSYRNKVKYELTIIDENGKERAIPLDERPLPLCGFTTGFTKRYSCYDCQFAKGHRLSDVTIGDFWGGENFKEEKQKGVSVAIVHSSRGNELMERASLKMTPIRWRDFLIHNPRMVYGYDNVPNRRKRLAEDFTQLSYERLQEEYGNKGTWIHPISKLKRVLRILSSKRVEKKRQHFVDNLLKENNL